MSIKLSHNAGFFSCCSVLLDEIIKYVNIHHSLPTVDSSAQFKWYKPEDRINDDITYDYFEHYDNIESDTEIFSCQIDFIQQYQFGIYSKLNYKNIQPIVKKYFSPSVEIKKIIAVMENKYTLNYDNICVLFYRGNDKNRETLICGYDEYFKIANIILQKNPQIIFLIQSDETEFIEYFLTKFPNNSLYFKDEIRHIKKCDSTVDMEMKSTNYQYSKYYLAITHIMAKCNTVVCGSGNCSIWIMLFRGNCKNVYQQLYRQWFIS
jgi:hypothetical protein